MNICAILEVIKSSIPKDFPALKLRKSYKRNPYTILMVTLLSLRSKDEKTALVANKLFNTIKTPKELLELSIEELEDAIKPIGMQKQKAKTLVEVSKVLVEKFGGEVPKTKEELLSIKGIGEKTANILLNNAYNKSVIAVDTHVHRISNLLGIIDTKDEKESSKVLNDIVPKECKSEFNFYMVAFGQTICKVKSPLCPICPLKKVCKGFL
jgi:endonuclease-3